MSAVEERVANLEDTVQEHAIHIADIRSVCEVLRGDMRDLRQEMRDLRHELRGEMQQLRASIDHRFTWLIGIVVTSFVVTIGTIAGAFWGLLQAFTP